MKVDILCVFRTSFIRQPSIGGKEVDLFLLHNRVDVLGGYDKVCIVAHNFSNLPPFTSLI